MEKIPYIGVDIEDVTSEGLKVEYNPNRPDLGIITGVAKAYNGITRHETGLVHYDIDHQGFELQVEKSVQPVRPYVAGAVVRNIPMSEDTLKDIIALQEDLHQTIGRGRRKVSIGLHDLQDVHFPVRYLAVGPDSQPFLPLGEDEPMRCEEILREMDTGVKYAYILGDKDLYPLIVDDTDSVLSFPPIINSEVTRVDSETSDLFIDVTGTDRPAIQDSLNILVTSLGDYGADLYSIDLIQGEEKEITPDIDPRETRVETTYIQDLLGMELEDAEIVECLEACRLDASHDNGEMVAQIPPYRSDIMHPVDIVEDIAIGYGYWRIEPVLPQTFGLGEPLASSRLQERISGLMVGAGFVEVISYALSSRQRQFRDMNLEARHFVKVKSPKSLENEIVRLWITPNLLETLRISKKETYPQRIFEIGTVARREDNEVVEEEHLAAAITHTEAGYSDAKAMLDTLASLLELDISVAETAHGSFIPGRVGVVLWGDQEIGLLGEISPQVLDNLQLDLPVAALELDLSSFYP